MLVFSSALMFGCADKIKEQPISTYYSVDSLLNRQLELLTKQAFKVEKSIAIDGEQELDTVTFDSLGWSNELAVFRIADINKPNLKDQYEATEERNEEMKIWHYVAKKKSLGIEFLHVYFNGANELQKLEAKYNEDNALYTSERNLTMYFSPGRSMVESYKVNGSQTMVMTEPVNFSISSKILN